MNNVVLLTGAGGFLGSQIARQLIRTTDCTIIALVRATDGAAATRRLARAWWDWPETRNTIGDRVQVLCGDVAAPDLGLDKACYDDLTRQVTHIIHAAADLGLNAPIDELRKTNVQGTANVLAFARAIHRDHGLARLAHVSSAYVAGGRRGEVPENALTDEFGFSSAYELSKYEGERLVAAAKAELPISVFRPGMIVGAAATGVIKTFNTIYFPLRLYLTGALRLLPANPALRVNLVPVDYVAAAITRLTFTPEAAGLNFHLVAPYEALPKADELVEQVREWARLQLNLHLPKPIFLPLPQWLTRGRYRPDGAKPSKAQKKPGLFDDLRALAPYFNEQIAFRRDNVDRLLGPYDFQWRTILPHLLAYAVYMGFMHRSERTVHEQILHRLGTKSRRITYYDLVEGQCVPHSATEVRSDMLAAAGALRALGIQPGDRVALVGLNSTRYLTLDVAIGLVGAVSVPLYYTSPPSEIDAIMAASGARLLFVGAPKLLARLCELRTEAPVISFCRETSAKNDVRPMMAWPEFLALGAGSNGPTTAPVGFGDLATLRYTSGTTGQPKGVTFNHGHLRWMGECIAGLMPWQTRNRAIAYLSFLPLNHVVEGILATYSPYYLPAPVDIYFLEDIYAVARALPRIRPHLFFAVPRIYEKVWEGLQKNWLGRFYLDREEGIVKRLLRPLLRWRLLRQAGFDRCTQLMVGSAAVSEGLLRAFHDLGIEIHNAYGLTEAPLVTINRAGANRIGTAGEPLPETQLQIAADGEVLVRGPQVTTGYFDQTIEQPSQAGWLHTGDLGAVNAEGRLVILGRKKELIKTAYGKYVHPAKIEGLLKAIPGVAEALLVGEGRPYGSAFLWINADACDQRMAAALDTAIGQINSQLSHPEQVKRWAILTNDLSVEGGELTPNLKLKRLAVVRRFQALVDALYSNGAISANVLHCGQAEREVA
ncbi:MAG: NAD-dependent epimerase/dehydratase family protein [Caldilinea sp. CFX5]|nr:NAD-dependent epimerase/dehydratase family protein [Caldilinea sp. CFX5]